MAGNYTILGELAKGGMATVYLGQMQGSAGFTRLVAIKRLHPELATDHDFVMMLVDEARLAGQVRHPNVIDTLDLVANEGAFSLVLEYVEGDSLSALIRQARQQSLPIPRPIGLTIVRGVLRGLHAAHEARSNDGAPLGLVHRDVSPQNILVGTDGIPRLIDFGIAKATGRLMSTRPGEIRGKFSYMSPEQLLNKPVTRQADVYATGVVLWELLTGKRLFWGEDSRAIAAAVLRGEVPPPSQVDADLEAFDEVIARSTARDLGDRYLEAAEMLRDLEQIDDPVATDAEVGAWVRTLAARTLEHRQKLLSSTQEAEISSEDILRDLARSSRPSVTPTPRSASRPSRHETADMADSAAPIIVLQSSRPPAGRISWLVPVITALVILGTGVTVFGVRTVRDSMAAKAQAKKAAATAPSSSSPIETATATAPPPAPPAPREPEDEAAASPTTAAASAAPTTKPSTDGKTRTRKTPGKRRSAPAPSTTASAVTPPAWDPRVTRD